ncbi:MAG: hypothetical protein U0457_17970 [Candidatus Sericytochromatia bacterium]
MSEINVSNLGLNTKLIDEIKNKKQEVKQFDSLDKAIDFSNKQVGDEAIVKTKDDSGKDIYTVVKIKTGAKASEVFDPAESLKFSSMITRDNKKIEDVSLNETDSTNETQNLINIANSDNVTGFKWNETGDPKGASVYQNNLKITLSKLKELEAKLNSKIEKLQTEISDLEKSNLEPDKLKSKKEELSNLLIKKSELETQKGILNIKLAIQPVSNEQIPDSDLKIGAFRKTPSQAIIALKTRIAILEKELKENKSPEKESSIKTQIENLNKELSFINKSTSEINVAAIKTNLRVGSLASMNNSLDKAKNDLESKLTALKELENNLKATPAEATKEKNPDGSAKIETQIKTLKAEINKIRLDLINNLKFDLKTFETNIPVKNNEAGKKSVELIQAQIKTLENLGDGNNEKALDIIKETQKKLLSEVIEGAKQFKGIEPKEAEMIGQIVNKTHNFVDTYKETQNLVKNLIIDVQKANDLNVFLYDQKSSPALDSAQTWTAGTTGLTGVEANKIINETYHHLNQQFNNYLGNPPIANWMTFGKFASREAGSQIKSLEGALESIKTLSKFDLAMGNDKRAIDALADIMAQDKMIEQGIRMGASSIGIKGAASMKGKDLILAMVDEIKKASLPYLPSDPKKAGEEAIKKITPIISNLETLHGALVKGNTRIYENIVPAFDIFMKAEASGNDGIKALMSAGFGKPSKNITETYVTPSNKDPQGFVLDAFKLYKEAKNLADKILIKEKDGAPQEEIDKLKKQREDITHKANLLIGCQEQMAILQASDIFNDPTVSSLLGAMTGTMSLQDSVSETALLPTKNGNHTTSENWADFQTRMGLEEVSKDTKGAIAVQDPSGVKHYYIPIEKPATGIDKGEGTISRYFKERLSGSDAKTDIDGPPRAMEPFYLDNVGGQTTIGDYAPQPDSLTIIPKGVSILPKAYDQIF